MTKLETLGFMTSPEPETREMQSHIYEGTISDALPNSVEDKFSYSGNNIINNNIFMTTSESECPII